MWMDMGNHGWGMGAGLVFVVLFWVLAILAIAALVKWLLMAQASRAPPLRTALDILQERYARGEIGREEYLQKRNDMEGKYKES